MKVSRTPNEINEIKDEILASALEMLVNDGFHSLTMRGLGRKLDMTAPNLYNYFADKDAIYITLMTRGFAELSKALSEASAQHTPDPLVRARGVMRRYVRFGVEQRSYYELMFSAATPKYRDFVGTASEALSEQEHRLSMQVADFARELIRDVAGAVGLKVSAADAQILLTGVWALLHGAVSLANSQNLEYVVDDVPGTVDALIEQITTPELLSLLSRRRK